MILKYTSVANKFIEELKKNKDVLGVMHLGGIARGSADEYSDIDISVFSYEPLKIELGEKEVEPGCIIETFNVAINQGYDDWSSIQKEAYQEGVIAYDTNDTIKDFLDKALFYDEKKRIKDILTLVFEIAWHGWVYKPFQNKKIKGYKWVLPNNLWQMRGFEKNAYYVANQSVNYLIELLYAINKKWVPDYKWRYIKSFNLNYLPKKYEMKINYLLYEEWNELTWSTKDEYFQSMLDEIIGRIEGELPEDWYAVIDK